MTRAEKDNLWLKITLALAIPLIGIVFAIIAFVHERIGLGIGLLLCSGLGIILWAMVLASYHHP